MSLIFDLYTAPGGRKYRREGRRRKQTYQQDLPFETGSHVDKFELLQFIDGSSQIFVSRVVSRVFEVLCTTASPGYRVSIYRFCFVLFFSYSRFKVLFCDSNIPSLIPLFQQLATSYICNPLIIPVSQSSTVSSRSYQSSGFVFSQMERD